MAHRTNVNQIPMDLPKSDTSEAQVVDPVCGKKMPRKEARHVLFQAGDAIHFCSRECRDKYRTMRYSPKAA